MDRPLNKAEQKLFARLYTASLLQQSAMHMVGVSEREEEGIDEAIDGLIEKLLDGHGTQASTTHIIHYIKGLRK